MPSSKEEIAAKIKSVDVLLVALGEVDDPEVQAVVASKRVSREALVAQFRFMKPLHVQCRLAAEHRDKLVKKHLDFVAEARALEETVCCLFWNPGRRAAIMELCRCRLLLPC